MWAFGHSTWAPWLSSVTHCHQTPHVGSSESLHMALTGWSGRWVRRGWFEFLIRCVVSTFRNKTQPVAKDKTRQLVIKIEKRWQMLVMTNLTLYFAKLRTTAATNVSLQEGVWVVVIWANYNLWCSCPYIGLNWLHQKVSLAAQTYLTAYSFTAWAEDVTPCLYRGPWIDIEQSNQRE